MTASGIRKARFVTGAIWRCDVQGFAAVGESVARKLPCGRGRQRSNLFFQRRTHYGLGIEFIAVLWALPCERIDDGLSSDCVHSCFLS